MMPCDVAHSESRDGGGENIVAVVASMCVPVR